VGLGLALTGASAVVAGAALRARASAGLGAGEVVGITASTLGAGLAASDDTVLAWALTAILVALMVASLVARHVATRYPTAAAVVSVLATWSWLGVAGLEAVEAYTLPAALVTLVLGMYRRRAIYPPGSWPTLGPGLMLAFGPSLLLALTTPGGLRPILLLTAATAAVVAGARGRLQAPVVLGGAVLVLVALDALAPVAAQVPRWMSVALAGLLLLWLGATVERRLRDLRNLRGAYDALESPGADPPL
jgi:hypothetical protein